MAWCGLCAVRTDLRAGLVGLLGLAGCLQAVEVTGPLASGDEFSLETEEARLGEDLTGSTLNDLREKFAKSPPEGLNKFAFDEEGNLVTTSGRVALLEAVNRSGLGPDDETALAFSREVAADVANSPNERIVALRNVVIRSPEEKQGLGVRLLEDFLTEEMARQAPFAFSQALDGVVYLRDESLIPVLSGLTKQADLVQPIQMTLQRLAAANPLAVARALNEQPDLLTKFPAIRGDLFAILDPSEPLARRELELYLQRDDVGRGEKRRTLRRLAQPAFVIGGGIFTGEDVPPVVTDERESARMEWMAELREREEYGWISDELDNPTRGGAP